MTLTVLIASPGDTADARLAVEQVIYSWNSDRARQTKVHLLPLRWETDAVPELIEGSDAQSVINRQFAEEADIVVGLFHSRLGSPTARAASGTAEEIDRSIDRGACVHVYCSEMPIHRDKFDTKQYEALQEFRADLDSRGLVGSYASLDDLRAKIRTALEHDVHELVGQISDEETVAPEPTGAILIATHEYDREPHASSKGKVRMRNTHHRITVTNAGDTPADEVQISISTQGEGDSPLEPREKNDGVRILPGASYNFPVYLTMATAPHWDVTVTWRENGEERSERQSLSAY